MSPLLITLIIAVALEAAVIVALGVKLRRHNTPQRFTYEEPMPWMEEERK